MQDFSLSHSLLLAPYSPRGGTNLRSGALTLEALQKLPHIQDAMREAVAQVQRYGARLMARYVNLRLRRYAVVALGFERLWWVEVEETV